MNVLSEDEIKRFSSPYYLNGLQEDHVTLDKISIGQDRISANVLIKHLYFDNIPGATPHFPGLLALQWSFYLAVLYGKWEDAKMRRPFSPLRLRENTMKCKKLIVARSFSAELQLLKSRQLKHGLFQLFKVDFDDGKFSVTMTGFKERRQR